MGFAAISIDKFVKKHLKDNPSVDEKDLRKRLNSALTAYKNGEKCPCGNDIWVIGSAFTGNSCFTCITGDSHPDSNYEIDLAIKKSDSTIGRRHIDEIDKTQISGFFDDNGYEINSELIEKPSLCLTCIKNENPDEDIFCNMTRYDQRDENEFKCFAYHKIV